MIFSVPILSLCVCVSESMCVCMIRHMPVCTGGCADVVFFAYINVMVLG